jgi:hypothetical protein
MFGKPPALILPNHTPSKTTRPSGSKIFIAPREAPPVALASRKSIFALITTTALLFFYINHAPNKCSAANIFLTVPTATVAFTPDAGKP